MREERKPSDYSYIFANEGHKEINTWEEFKTARWSYATMGFFYKNELIGHAQLDRVYSHKRRLAHTSDVRLLKKFRKKGHGIHLYLTLIEIARNMGVEILYSDWTLNKNSRRMWADRLPKYFKVHRRGGCKMCANGGRFYINLKECPKPSPEIS
jgi:hypothetical protein